ncbi:MAG TPA: mannose-1-phosphate guanylyltransferase [Mycobacteriales bacterium]|nr:mannose-1-phosphate guanylyltransferase [Mycobacteriales bacterium]
MTFSAVVPAGGSGTRLWPLSRAHAPKFLHDLTGGGRSLLQSTVDRLGPLAPPERTFVITGGAHAVAVARQLPSVPAENVLVEPSPRDSAPAIGLAAAVLHERDPDGVMGSFASDHVVLDRPAFVAALQAAIEVAATGRLVTIGMTPTRPEPGFGYIHRGPALGLAGAHAVSAFTEKPPYDVARAYVESGEYLWNASMFVWRTSSFLAELARQQPELHDGLRRIAADWDTPRRDETLAGIWPALPRISVDHAVMEGAAAQGLVATVPAMFGWSDVGDWDGLGMIAGDGSPVTVLGDTDRVLAVDTTGSVVLPGSGRLVTMLGLRDVVVVDTEDAVLVCSRDRAQEVKGIVDALKARGATDLV